jgi:hypothetical protein
MRLAKLSMLLTASVLLSLACNLVTSLSEVPPTITPTDAPTATPTSDWSPAPMPTRTPIPMPMTLTAIPIPAWVMGFSDPILGAVSDQWPAISDDFSPYNLGWHIVNPENSRKPFYAHVQDGALFLNLPEGKIYKDLTVYNPRLLYKNFVLSFDFKFGKTEPDDILRYQFSMAADEKIALDLSKSESRTFYWNLHGGPQSSTGMYDYFPPEYLNVTIIMQGTECAVYLNHDPVDYLRECRTEPRGQPSALTMSLHLLGTGRPALVILDNVKLWDLDALP